MSSIGRYPDDAPITQVAASNASATLLAALTGTDIGKRIALAISVPSTNTGNLYLSFGSTVPTSSRYDAKILPGGRGAYSVPIHQGIVRGILDVVGPENVNVAVDEA